MNSEPPKQYPGNQATVAELIALADVYCASAHCLIKHVQKNRKPVTRAPAYSCAIHAIELYLNALLLGHGMKPKDIRGQNHDLQSRLERAADVGMKLKIKTFEHLIKITSDREYLVVRYGPEQLDTLSDINRILSTLEEIAKKTKELLEFELTCGRHANPSVQ